RQFFDSVREVDVRLEISALQLSGDSAECTLSGLYVFENATTRRTEQQHASIRMTLGRSAAGDWGVLNIREEPSSLRPLAGRALAAGSCTPLEIVRRPARPEQIRPEPAPVEWPGGVGQEGNALSGGELHSERSVYEVVPPFRDVRRPDHPAERRLDHDIGGGPEIARPHLKFRYEINRERGPWRQQVVEPRRGQEGVGVTPAAA